MKQLEDHSSCFFYALKTIEGVMPMYELKFTVEECGYIRDLLTMRIEDFESFKKLSRSYPAIKADIETEIQRCEELLEKLGQR